MDNDNKIIAISIGCERTLPKELGPGLLRRWQKILTFCPILALTNKTRLKSFLLEKVFAICLGVNLLAVWVRSYYMFKNR